MPRHNGLEVLYFNTKAGFSKWLKANWEQSESVWLKLAKKDTGVTSVTYEEAREVAICYGWIDGLINKLDDTFYLIKFSKRLQRSTWSKINREIVETLIKQNKMRPSGLAEVERAKADGRWAAAYDSPKNMTVPTWFIKELKQHKAAYIFFNTLNKANHYSVAYHLRTAKQEATKQRRAQKYIEMFKRGEKIH